MGQNIILPHGWNWATIGDVIGKIPLTGRKLPQGNYSETGKYPVIHQGQQFIGGYTDEELSVPCELPVIIFGDHTRVIKYINFPFVAGADGVKVLKPSSVFFPKLFYYFLQAIELPNKGYARHFQFLEREFIPLPPLPEQKRIVAKIEALFTQLEAGMAALRRVQAGLKRYKTSVFKAAVEGRLVAQNPSDEPASELLRRLGKSLMVGDGLPSLPDGWQWVSFSEIITLLKNGYFYGRPATEPPGIPILRISAVRPLSVNFDEPRYIPDVNEKDVKDYFLEKGDLLFTRYNGNKSLVGACGLVGELHKRVLYPDKLIRVKVDEQIVLPNYAQVYFATQTARNFIESRIKSTAGQHGIAGGDIKSIPFILPPLEEQHRIVAEVEQRLSVVHEIETVVSASLARAGRLRQAILKQAFEGKLVAQNPEDAQAEALIEKPNETEKTDLKEDYTQARLF